jgi:hypothetical protein
MFTRAIVSDKKVFIVTDAVYLVIYRKNIGTQQQNNASSFLAVQMREIMTLYSPVAECKYL